MRNQTTIPLSDRHHPPQASETFVSHWSGELGETLSAGAWRALRRRVLQPLHHSEFVSSAADRVEFSTGAALLRIHGHGARPGNSVKPQQVAVVDMLAAGHPRSAVLMPRRSSKSTSLVGVALGRAAHREDYRVGILTLTSGKAGRSRFMKDVAPAIERLGSRFGDDPKAWPFKLIRSAGQERVEFRDGGGMVQWLSSIEDLRGEAFDLVILDEAQAADPEKAADVIAAALPTLDTRPGAQVVVAGTVGESAEGNLLAAWLQDGREGKAGILEYAAPEDTPEDALQSWETVEPLVLAHHPGVGTLTTLEAVRSNYDALPREKFAREYLGLWGSAAEGRAVISRKAMVAAGVDDAPLVPDRFSVAMATAFNQSAASIVAAWRDDDGFAHGYVLDHRHGTTWLADVAAAKARQHTLPLVYDGASGPLRVEVEAMQRMRPRPRLEPQNTAHVTAAAALLVKEINTGRAVHYKQPALEDAARVAVRRSVGANAWALGRPPKQSDIDLSALEAWALALRYFDENPVREILRPVMAS